ncbi:hypothetical protein GHK86_15880, partial [Acidimicrobiaceae bacterium USS-CC1]|nr:hypothetical protein [Acidiferrimicrobium australe]
MDCSSRSLSVAVSRAGGPLGDLGSPVPTSSVRTGRRLPAVFAPVVGARGPSAPPRPPHVLRCGVGAVEVGAFTGLGACAPERCAAGAPRPAGAPTWPRSGPLRRQAGALRHCRSPHFDPNPSYRLARPPRPSPPVPARATAGAGEGAEGARETPALASAAMRARAPGSAANLGPGFDALALALDLHVVVDVEPAERLAVTATGHGADLPQDAGHLAAQVAVAVAGTDRLAIHVHSDIPVGRGLGSSAALAV